MAARRTFDHDEARRLRAEGLSYAEIARRLGISTDAVRYAAAPREDIERRAAAAAAYIRARRRKGHHYDYVRCECGHHYDPRRRCGDCVRARRGPTKAQLRAEARARSNAAKTRLFHLVRSLHKQGFSWTQITELTGVPRGTARRWGRMTKPPLWRRSS